MNVITPYAVYTDCVLKMGTYRANKSLCISIIGKCEGKDFLEPIATLTVCLPERKRNEPW